MTPSPRALAFLLLVLPACAATGQEDPPPPAFRGHVQDVVLHLQAPYVELELGGSRGLFLFDTGANVSGLDATWLEETGAPHQDAGRSSVGGTTGSVAVRRVAFERLDLGNGFFLGPVFTVQDYGHFSQPGGRRQAGLLGTDFINRYQVDLDYRTGKLALALAAERGPAPDGFAPVPVTYPLGLPTVEVDVAGESVPCRLDTGAAYIDPDPFLDVNRAAFEAIRARGVRLEKKGEIRVTGISGPEVLPLYVCPDPPGLVLEIGPWRLQDVVLVVHERGTFQGPEPLALAPASIFGRLGRFVLDPFARRLWVPK